MTPIAAVDENGRRCVIVAFVGDRYGAEAVVAYGPYPLRTVPVNDLIITPNDEFPAGWIEWPSNPT